jgi:hypothetical protein
MKAAILHAADSVPVYGDFDDPVEAAVPSALLRSRKITISGSGAGSVAAADIKGQIPVYIKLIAEGGVQVPFRTFLLSDVGAAWTASAQAGPRVVLVPG